MRTTVDLDTVIAARSHPHAFGTISEALQEMGFLPVAHISGIEHRWHRELATGGKVQVDILLPTNLGRRAPTSINGRPGVPSKGAQWASDMSRLWRLRTGAAEIVVPVPTLVGSVIAKSSALLNSNDRDPSRHLSDLAFLIELATFDDLRQPVSRPQAHRVIQALNRLGRESTAITRMRMAMERSAP